MAAIKKLSFYFPLAALVLLSFACVRKNRYAAPEGTDHTVNTEEGLQAARKTLDRFYNLERAGKVHEAAELFMPNVSPDARLQAAKDFKTQLDSLGKPERRTEQLGTGKIRAGNTRITGYIFVYLTEYPGRLIWESYHVTLHNGEYKIFDAHMMDKPNSNRY